MGHGCITPLSTIFLLIISWRSVLLVEKTELPKESHRFVASQTNLIKLYRVYLKLYWNWTHNLSGDIDRDCIGNCYNIFPFLSPHSRHLLQLWALSSVTRRVPHMEQELLTLSDLKHLSSPQFLMGSMLFVCNFLYLFTLIIICLCLSFYVVLLYWFE